MTNEQLVLLIRAKVDVSENMLQLWRQNRGVIAKIAGRYKGYEELEDLNQQGYIGLCNAVDGYRADEGVPFINYAAFWIRQSIGRYIEDNGSVLRLPVHERQRQRKYKKLVHDFEMQTGRKPEKWEICRYMGISLKTMENMEHNAHMGRIGSLDACLDDEGDTIAGEMVQGGDNVEREVLDRVESEEFKTVLWEMVDSLPDKQPFVLRSIYQNERTLKQTGEMIGVSAERTRRIRDAALRAFRRSGRKEKLMAFLPEAVECLAYRHNGVAEFGRTWTSSTELAALKMYEEIARYVPH